MTSPIIASALAFLLALPSSDPTVQRYAIAISDAVEATGADSWTMIALGWHESRLQADARSSVNATGPWQLLPRWHRETFADCRRNPDVCTALQANAAARTLTHYASVCPGLGRTIRAYRSGRPGGHCLEPRSRDMATVALRNKLARVFGRSDT